MARALVRQVGRVGLVGRVGPVGKLSHPPDLPDQPHLPYNRCMSRFILTTLFLTITANSALAQRLLILNKDDATLSIVDAASGKTLATITTGAGPHEVVVSDDGKLRVLRAITAPGRRRATAFR